MRKSVILSSIISAILFFLFTNAHINAQNSDSTLMHSKLFRYWELKEYKENGKVQDLPEYLIEFRSDGSYYSIEEDEPDAGTWEFDNNNTIIIFDKDTPAEDVWNIVSLEDAKLVIKFTSEGKNYQYTLLPAVLDFK